MGPSSSPDEPLVRSAKRVRAGEGVEVGVLELGSSDSEGGVVVISSQTHSRREDEVEIVSYKAASR